MASDLKLVNGTWEVRVRPQVKSGDIGLEQQMLVAFLEAFELWTGKQKDYGPNNIAQAGEAGVALRANDKVQRLRTLLLTDTPVTNESIRDTWLDLINYAAMGLLLRDGLWPKSRLSDAPARCPKCGTEIGLQLKA